MAAMKSPRSQAGSYVRSQPMAGIHPASAAEAFGLLAGSWVMASSSGFSTAEGAVRNARWIGKVVRVRSPGDTSFSASADNRLHPGQLWAIPQRLGAAFVFE